VIYPHDAFGEAVLQGVETALKANGAAPVETASYVGQSNDSPSAIAKVNAANPDAVVVVGPSNTVAAILKSAHAKAWTPPFVTVLFVGTDELLEEAGADAEGVVITQVVPPYYLTDLKTVAPYRRSLSKYMPSSKPNSVSLEGFVDAMVIVEGLKKQARS
jgi:branched-chain amino acid transport system substrate-binding protein